ncbi:MAG: glycerol-3-phosphate dehydrogenase/oxidase [Beutenbergiaceae bacterium]
MNNRPATAAHMSAREHDLAAAALGADVVVIGGGANGCATAWDAALRGLRVVLLEKHDVGWATSAWNSRMIHGGLKYLEKYDVALVRESLREREWLLRAAPHLVEPLQFVLPFYQRNAHPAGVLKLGLAAYDILSWDKSTPNRKVFNRDRTRDLIPGLDDDGLQGSGAYYDCQISYSERLSVELAAAARAAGAVVLNHAHADRILVTGQAVQGVEFTDEVTGASYTIPTRKIVNAAGPWVDEVMRETWPKAPPLMGGTKGTHLVVDDFPGAPRGVAMYYEAMTDARPMMVIPWLDRYLIGATDVRFDGDLDRASRDEDELNYILRETNLLFPRANLTPADVHWSYTGVRPLPHQAEGPTGDITRRHMIRDHGKDSRNRVRGLYSVIGGKLTTCRGLAEEVVDELTGKHRRIARRGPTWHLRLPGAADPHRLSRTLAARNVEVPVAHRLAGLYGSRAWDVLALAASRPELTKPLPGADGLTAAEVAFALEVDGAVTLEDIVARRIMTGLDNSLGLDSLTEIATAAAKIAGWDAKEKAAQVRAYKEYITKFQPAAV